MNTPVNNADVFRATESKALPYDSEELTLSRIKLSEVKGDLREMNAHPVVQSSIVAIVEDFLGRARNMRSKIAVFEAEDGVAELVIQVDETDRRLELLISQTEVRPLIIGRGAGCRLPVAQNRIMPGSSLAGSWMIHPNTYLRNILLPGQIRRGLVRGQAFMPKAGEAGEGLSITACSPHIASQDDIDAYMHYAAGVAGQQVGCCGIRREQLNEFDPQEVHTIKKNLGRAEITLPTFNIQLDPIDRSKFRDSHCLLQDLSSETKCPDDFGGAFLAKQASKNIDVQREPLRPPSDSPSTSG